MEDLPASHVWVPKLWLLVNFQTFQAQFFGGTKRIAGFHPLWFRVDPTTANPWSKLKPNGETELTRKPQENCH